MPVDKMLVNKMSVDKVSVGQMTGVFETSRELEPVEFLGLVV